MVGGHTNMKKPLRQGAAAAIIIHETAPASYGWDVVSGSWSGEQYDLSKGG